MSDSLYRAQLLDHYEHPHHYGTINNATHRAEGANLSCGDEMSITATVTDGIITDAAFTARACVVCTASASLLMDEIIGTSLTDIAALQTKDVTDAIGIDLSPVRLKCALLPLETLKNLETVEPTPAA